MIVRAVSLCAGTGFGDAVIVGTILLRRRQNARSSRSGWAGVELPVIPRLTYERRSHPARSISLLNPSSEKTQKFVLSLLHSCGPSKYAIGSCEICWPLSVGRATRVRRKQYLAVVVSCASTMKELFRR